MFVRRMGLQDCVRRNLDGFSSLAIVRCVDRFLVFGLGLCTFPSKIMHDEGLGLSQFEDSFSVRGLTRVTVVAWILAVLLSVAIINSSETRIITFATLGPQVLVSFDNGLEIMEEPKK